MAKLGSASIRLVQKLNRKNKVGEYPIYIVVCWHGRVEKSTSVSCLQKYWDCDREVIKRSCPNAPVLNKMLSDVKQRCINRKNEFEYQGRVYTASMLLDDIVVDLSPVSNIFKDIMERLIDDRRLRYKTQCKYRYAYGKICEFLGKDDFIVDELNLGFIKDFLKWLNVGEGTKRDICSVIASVWNYAIDKKLSDGSEYPFREYKFTQKLKNGERDYFLDKSHIIRLKEYWLDLCVNRDGKRWSYKDGVLDRLHKRSSKEFGILWFLLMYKLNGSAPIEIAYLKSDSCRSIEIAGERYWAIDFKRQKTSVDVHVRWKRDMFCIIALEHYLGYCKDFVYPIIGEKNIDDIQMQRACNKASESAIKWVRMAFKDINDEIIRENVNNGLHQPLIECEKVVMYTARHSFACHYLSMPNASVSGLASLLSRSPNTIATYIHQLTKDVDIAEEVSNMPI